VGDHLGTSAAKRDNLSERRVYDGSLSELVLETKAETRLSIRKGEERRIIVEKTTSGLEDGPWRRQPRPEHQAKLSSRKRLRS